MKKLVAILFIILPLTGCVPAALVVGATAGGAIIYDKRSIKTMAQDRDATQHAQNIVNNDPELKGRAHIAITTYDHTTVMAGQAETPELRQRAYQLVSKVKRIKKLYNEITIGKPIGGSTQMGDNWITTKVKTALLTAKGVPSNQIKVMTDNHTVYLLGMVTRNQADLAASVARRIGGVRKVVMAFRYI